MSSKRLYLIDGSALFYRSYFAFLRNPLINSKGENTSATYGFTLALMKILYEEKPDFLAVVFDSAKPTFRHKSYKKYKATREKMPEEMVAQYPRVLQLIDSFNIANFEPPAYIEDANYSYEADDVIGTLAKQAEPQQIETYMVTGDKDFMQLLSPLIKMYKMRSGQSAEIIDEKYVENNFGLNPQQIIDFLALMGDSSDNIPGVPKVGQKTAQELLEKFGSLDNLYKNLDKIPKKAIRQSLEENREQANLSRELVTIDIAVPVNRDIQSMTINPLDTEKVVQLFEQLEFRSLITRIQENNNESAPIVGSSAVYDADNQDYQLINTPERLQVLVDQLQQQSFFVFDTETTGLQAFKSEVIGISFCWQKHQAYYVPLNDRNSSLTSGNIIEFLKPIFENPGIKKGGQNIKYDALMLWQHGINLQGTHFDTMIASFLVSPGLRQNNLEALAENYLNYKMISIDTLIGKKGKDQKSMFDISVNQVCPYACEDADITYQLKEILEKKLPEVGTEQLFHAVEMPLVEVLAKMEINGVSLDTKFLEQMSLQLKKEANQIQKEIYESVGEEFNINSPQQLGKILFDKLAIHQEMGVQRPRRTPTGQYSTSESVLLKYRQHPIVNKILEYRKVSKLKSTYVDALPLLISPRTGRLHTTFSQTVTATGRLSSSDPNLQNIPIRGERGREIRKAFIPAENGNYLLSADYSQVELRLMAHLSGDPALREAFLRDEDIHSSTAAAIFSVNTDEVTAELRRKAKEVNFGIIYGISRYGLASRLYIAVEEAEEIIQSYFFRFPKVNEYIITVIQHARANRYVTTILKRRRYVPEIDSRNNTVRQNTERIAINTTIQGSAADLIKLAMIHIHQRLIEENLKTKMILQVHDELVFEVPKGELDLVKSLVKQEMEQAMQLNIPLKVDVGVGANWLEAH